MSSRNTDIKKDLAIGSIVLKCNTHAWQEQTYLWLIDPSAASKSKNYQRNAIKW